MAEAIDESQRVAKTLHRIFTFLYLQFAFYWATIAAGMFVNYYYSVPASVQADFSGVFSQIFAAPSLFAHVTFAVLSTSMSIPVIIYARRVKLTSVVLLHAGAIASRTVGFITGPLFVYYSTTAISNGDLANISTFVMASVFLMAVILTFLSRIFIVREDVRIKYLTTSGALPGSSVTWSKPS
ncbi:MAG TPA: hypothetical protein VEJ19_05505 [Nitrososphaerales archaeon]|nr:hypothetical protein [Nitrososphaerales archaeon]